LKSLIKRISHELHLEGKNMPVAKLYKLLLYEQGGHFLPHKDTEKEKGMFATLIVQLPSRHTGGELIVSHGGNTVTCDFGQSSGKSPFSCFFAAHYADVEHEVTPITSGYRLALVYSLVLGQDVAPTSSNTRALDVAPLPEPVVMPLVPLSIADLISNWDLTTDIPIKLALRLGKSAGFFFLSSRLRNLLHISQVQ